MIAAPRPSVEAWEGTAPGEPEGFSSSHCQQSSKYMARGGASPQDLHTPEECWDRSPVLKSTEVPPGSSSGFVGHTQVRGHGLSSGCPQRGPRAPLMEPIKESQGSY